MSWCTSSRNQNISFVNRLKYVQPKDAFRLHCKKVGKIFDFEVPTFFFFSEHVCCFDSIESQSYSTEAEAVGGNILKSHQISPHQRPNLLTVHLFWLLFCTRIESWRIMKNEKMETLVKLENYFESTTRIIIEGSRFLLIFSLFLHALLLFLYFEMKIEISWNSRSSKAKSSNDNFARNGVCNYIETIIIFNISPNFWSVSILL